jgi:pantoate--beta-alanine ligase
MSSRNTYLNHSEREAATILFKALSLAKTLKEADETRADIIRGKMISFIKSEPLAQIEYVSIADTSTLKELSTVDTQSLVSMAVRVGRTRLIDNIII